MRITIRRIACVAAVAAGPLVACNPANPTTPGFEPATATARASIEIRTPDGDTLRSCPEVSIPEHPCLSADLRQP